MKIRLAQTLAIAQLTLTDFRNYAGLRVAPQARMVVLAGANGAGKTNLLEAVSLLSPGRGLRRAPFCELARQGGPERWAVAAHTQGPHGLISLGTGWAGEAEGQEASRQVSIDGVRQKSPGTLGGYFSVLWLTPSMDRLFSGPASDRRRFLDRLVMAFDPAHGARVSSFERLMRERNRLLEGPKPDDSWVSSVEVQMAEVGVAVAAGRAQAFEALSERILRNEGEGEGEGSGFPWPDLHLEGELEALLAATSAVEVEDQYRRILSDSRGLDAAAGRTLRGPHRSDLEVRHGPKDVPAKQCSTGEQKALLVSTVLAHARLIKSLDAGTAPVLLLDEIAAHLDETRRVALFEVLEELQAQVWMTGTDESLFAPLSGRAEFYRVEDGALAHA